MLLLRTLLLTLLCLPLLAACGGDDDDAPADDPTATTAEQDDREPTEAEPDENDDQMDDADDTDASGPEGRGEMHLEVDGQTFNAMVGLCEISDDEIRVSGFLNRDETEVSISVSRGGGRLGAVGVIIGEETTYVGNERDAEITTGDNTLTWVGEFSRPSDAGPESVGEGRLTASCPSAE